MNTNTGALYELSEPMAGFVASGPIVDIESFASAPAITEDDRRALEALAAGDRVVPVSGEVAQLVQLGQRERDRRKRRRKQARESRRRNR